MYLIATFIFYDVTKRPLVKFQELATLILHWGIYVKPAQPGKPIPTRNSEGYLGMQGYALRGWDLCSEKKG